MCETYNGYTNRETWALCLWLSNDHGLYEEILDVAVEALRDETDTSKYARYVGQALNGYVDEMFAALDDPTMRSAGLVQMAREVGSAWRIDWDEVGSAFLPSEHGR